MSSPTALVPHEQIVKVFPNFASLDPDTTFTVYREYKPHDDMIELTMLYTEPGKEMMRLDAEYFGYQITEELTPELVRLVSLRKAKP